MISVALTLALLAQATTLGCPSSPLAAPAQPPAGRLSFRSYGVTQGLTDLAASLIAQDGDGFLWAGTQSGGVFRYDGVRFRGYGREDGLPSDLVRALAVAPDGVLWVGTARGLARRAPGGHDGFVAVALAPARGAPQVTALAFDQARRLWVGTAGGLFRSDDGAHFSPVDDWRGREITALWADPAGGLFIGEAGALTHLDPDGRRQRWTADDGLDRTSIIGIARDGHGRLWVKSLDHLKVQDAASRRFADLSCLLRGRRPDAPLSLDRAGNLLLPTGDGLVRVRGNEVELIDAGRGLPTAFANFAFEDREGSLWVASVGLHKALGRDLWRTHAVAEGLPNDIVWAIARAPDGRLYAGTENGLARSTASGWETVPGTLGHTFGALRFGADGTLWSTGSTAGLLRLDVASGTLSRFGADAGLVSGDITLQLELSRAGEFWVSTRKNGLYRGSFSGGELRFAPYRLPGGDASERVNQILDAGDGRIWFAGAHGLALLDRGVAHRFTKRDGLADDGIGAVARRRDGELCVAYRGHGGVTCFRYAGAGLEQLHEVDARQGRRAVQFLGDDASGRLWAGSAMGVSVIGEHDVERFGTASGAPGDDCAELAFLAEPDGQVWIGTSTGLGHFDGRAYRGPPPPPATRVVAAQWGSRPLAGAADGQGARVPYGQGSLAIHYAALSFVDEARVRYETRIVGADDQWRATDMTEVQYAALAPGLYRFEVRARLGEGPPGASAQLALRVLPAWWQSWWFRGLVAGLLLGLALAAVRRRTQALHARNAELELLVAARTAALKSAHEKIAEAEKLSALGRLITQISHELNNPVNVISNNVEPIQEYVRDLVTALTECRPLAAATAEGRARVDELWESLELDFKVTDIDGAVHAVALAADRITAVHRDLRTFMHSARATKALGDVTEPLRETVEMMRRTLPREIAIVEDYGELPPIAFDRSRMNQLFLNLVKNAAEALGGQGRITIATRRLADAVEIAVSDSGPGVPPAVRARIFEPFFTTKDIGHGTGLGLAICRRIVVDDHHGQLELDEGYVEGARFVVRVPLQSRPGEA